MRLFSLFSLLALAPASAFAQAPETVQPVRLQMPSAPPVVVGEDNLFNHLQPDFRAARAEMKQWHRITVTFTGPYTNERATPNPFRDYRLDVTFSKDGRSFVVPGYYAADGTGADMSSASGDKWRAHFRPDEAGEWSFRASFRTGNDVAMADDGSAGAPSHFDGQSGTFTVLPTDKTGRDFRGKGILRREGRYLRFQNGEWFLKGGADSPENFLGYAGFDGAAPNSKTYEPHVGDWREGDPLWKGRDGKGIIGALNYLADQGMNSVYFLTNQVHVDGPRIVWPWVSPAPEDWDRYDCSKMDQWEMVFSHMTQKGIKMHVVLGERENDFLLDGGDLGPIRRLYYREMIARFGHHPAIVWNIGEEFLAVAANYTRERQTKFAAYTIPVLTKEQMIARASEFAAHIRALDPYDHPIVVHAQPTQKEDLFGGLLGDPNIDGPSLQHPTRGEIKRWIERSKAAGQEWFVSLDESGNADPLPAQLRPGGGTVGVAPDGAHPNHDGPRTGDLWGTYLAGGAGVEWYFGYQYNHNDTSTQDWRTRHRMWMFTRYAMEFMAQIPYHEMNHADALVTNGAYAFAKPNEVYAVYMPRGAATTLDLSGATGQFQTQWFNPRTGIWQDGPPVRGGGRIEFTVPAETDEQWAVKDWAVLVRRAGAQ